MPLVGPAPKPWRFSDPAQIYEMHDISDRNFESEARDASLLNTSQSNINGRM